MKVGLRRQCVFLRALVWLGIILILLPILLLLLWSFANRWPIPYLFPQTFTLRGWERLATGYFQIWQVMGASIFLSLMVGILAVLFATLAARAICLYRFPGRKWIEGLAMLPIIVPATVFGMGSYMVFIHLGVHHTLFAVIISHLIATLPFSLRIMIETTRMTSARLEEQARVLGANTFAGFWHGSLPALAPGLFSAWAIAFLFSYTQYFLTLLIGGGKIKTLSILVMPMIEGADQTISSVYSLVFIASAAGVFWILQGISAKVAKRTGKQLGGI